MQSFRFILQGISQLAKAWYAVDRIRISPQTGCLLRLEIGDSIVLRQDQFRIISRTHTDNSDTLAVRYQLQSDHELCELIVTSAINSEPPRLSLVHGDRREEIFSEEIFCLAG